MTLFASKKEFYSASFYIESYNVVDQVLINLLHIASYIGTEKRGGIMIKLPNHNALYHCSE